MAGNPGAGGGARAAAHVERRVALGDLTNVAAGGCRLGGPGAVLTEMEMSEARKVKSCFTNVECLKEKLLEEQGDRGREEMEPPMLKKIEVKADKTELGFGSCKVLLSDKPDVFRHGDVPQKQALTNLRKVGEDKDIAESAAEEANCLEHLLATVSEERDKPMKDQSMLTKQETTDPDVTALKNMWSGLHRMDTMFIEIHRTMDDTLIHQQDEHVFDERLSIERSKVQSLEQEVDQLRSQVALLQSKKNWYDDDDDDDEKPSLISNDFGSGEPGSESCHFTGSSEWFFHGNKLMLSSGMKKHLRELCGCVPPEIPFYIYQMNKSNLKRRGKMRLSAKYISKPLLSCLDKGVGYAHFEVDGEDHGTVRVQLNADGRASLTSGWENVVAAKDIKAGDICAFHFKISDGVLKLSVTVFHVVRRLVCVR